MIRKLIYIFLITISVFSLGLNAATFKGIVVEGNKGKPYEGQIFIINGNIISIDDKGKYSKDINIADLNEYFFPFATGQQLLYLTKLTGVNFHIDPEIYTYKRSGKRHTVYLSLTFTKDEKPYEKAEVTVLSLINSRYPYSLDRPLRAHHRGVVQYQNMYIGTEMYAILATANVLYIAELDRMVPDTLSRQNIALDKLVNKGAVDHLAYQDAAGRLQLFELPEAEQVYLGEAVVPVYEQKAAGVTFYNIGHDKFPETSKVLFHKAGSNIVFEDNTGNYDLVELVYKTPKGTLRLYCDQATLEFDSVEYGELQLLSAKLYKINNFKPGNFSLQILAGAKEFVLLYQAPEEEKISDDD